MLIDANHLINLFHPGCSFLSFLLLTSPTYLVPQSVKCLPAMRKMEDLGLIPGLGRFPGEGNGTPLQYSCLKESDTTERLHFLFFLSLSSTDSLWIIAIFLSILCSFIFFLFLVVALYSSNILYTFTPSPPNKHTPLTVPGLLCIFLTMKIFTTRLLLTQISAQFQLKYHVLKETIFDHPIYISREASTTLSCSIFSMSEWSRSVVSDFLWPYGQ